MAEMLYGRAITNKKNNCFKGITLRRKNTAYVSITVLLGNPEFENKQ